MNGVDFERLSVEPGMRAARVKPSIHRQGDGGVKTNEPQVASEPTGPVS